MNRWTIRLTDGGDVTVEAVSAITDQGMVTFTGDDRNIVAGFQQARVLYFRREDKDAQSPST